MSDETTTSLFHPQMSKASLGHSSAGGREHRRQLLPHNGLQCLSPGLSTEAVGVLGHRKHSGIGRILMSQS